MRQLKFLIKKEFLQLVRNKTILKIIIILPIIQLLVLPWAATFNLRNISLSVVDNDHSTYSYKLIDKIVSSGFFQLTDYVNTYAHALQMVEQNEADLILEIPDHFEKNIICNRQTQLMISINAINGQKAGLATAYISHILSDFSKNIILQRGSHSYPVTEINVYPYFKYNTEMNYQNYMVPGILAMLLTLIGGVLSSLSIVKEKEIGTIEQINVSPIPKSIFIMGKQIPFLIIGFVVLTIGLFIAWLVYGLSSAGNLFWLYLFSFFYLLTFLGAGLVISEYSNTQQQAMLIAFSFMVILFLLSGLFTPIKSMPEWVQTITYFNPVRYIVDIIRLVFMKGSTLKNFLPQLIIIICFSLFFNIWAILGYRKIL